MQIHPVERQIGRNFLARSLFWIAQRDYFSIARAARQKLHELDAPEACASRRSKRGRTVRRLNFGQSGRGLWRHSLTSGYRFGPARANRDRSGVAAASRREDKTSYVSRAWVEQQGFARTRIVQGSLQVRAGRHCHERKLRIGRGGECRRDHQGSGGKKSCHARVSSNSNTVGRSKMLDRGLHFAARVTSS